MKGTNRALADLSRANVPVRALILVHPSQAEALHFEIAKLGVFPVQISPNILVHPGRCIVIRAEDADTWRMSR